MFAQKAKKIIVLMIDTDKSKLKLTKLFESLSTKNLVV